MQTCLLLMLGRMLMCVQGAHTEGCTQGHLWSREHVLTPAAHTEEDLVIHTHTQQADLGHLWGVGRKQQGGEGLPGPSWRSALVGCSEWSPSCACQRGSQQGHSQSSRSAAPAAQTLAAIVSACDAGLPVSPVVTSSSPVPSGSHSGSEQERGGYPRTL